MYRLPLRRSLLNPPVAAAAAVDTSLVDYLESYWPLDENPSAAVAVTRYDFIYATGNDLTDNNTTDDAAGVQGQGADFERGNSEYLSIADNASLHMGDIDFAFAFWYKGESLSVSSEALLGKDDYGDSNREYIVVVSNVDWNLYWYCGSDGSSLTACQASTFGALSTGTWYFIYVYHDATANELGVSINNGTVDTASHSGGTYDGNQGFAIGAHFTSDTATGFADGVIDEVACWKNYIPTAAEVAWLYNSGSGRTLKDLLYTYRSEAPADSSLYDNLESYWRLDEHSNASGAVTRVDSHGSNDLTDNNTTASAAGKLARGADFELSNTEYLSIADNASLSGGDENWAWCAWVKMESKATTEIILSKDDYSDGNREYALYYSGGGTDRFRLLVSGNGTAVTTLNADTFGSPSLATWYFVYAYHDATANEIGISVNNGAFDTTSHTTGIYDGNQDFAIGAHFNGTAINYWDGIIDEVAVWKNYIPTAAEVTWLYNGGNGRTYDELYGKYKS